MAENEGLHLQLTADASGYISTINNAKNKLVELAAEVRILKQGEKDIQTALAESKRKYGENSIQVDRLTADLADNAREQEKLKQEIKEVNSVLDKATNEYREYGISAKQSFESVAQQSQKTAEKLKSGFNMVKGLIVGYAGKKLYEVLIGSNAEYEQSMVSFEVLLQSADKADAMMQRLEKMGAATPFELSDLTGATEQLLAFGVAEQDIEAKLQQLGDLAMGNAEKFERLTSAYGKMLAKGKVSLEELNMFTEAGVPILEELQKQYGVTGEEMFKMISDGKVGVEEINSAMKSMTGEGGQFFGMMEKQSKTLEGMLSTLTDNVNMFGRMVGEETFGILKEELEGLLATINQMAESGQLREIAHGLGQAIANLLTFIINLVKWMYEMRNVLIPVTAAVLAYKASFTVLTSACNIFKGVQSTLNMLAGKSVTVKNLETGATYTLTQAEYAEARQKEVAIVKQTEFNAVCNANVYIAAASAVLTLVSALVVFCGQSSEAKEITVDTTNELLDSYNQTKESILDTIAQREGEAQSVVALKDKLLALNEELQSETISQERATEAKREFNEYAEKLSEQIPNITDYLYDETGAINVQIDAVNNLAEAYITLAKAKAQAEAYKNLKVKAYETKAQAEKDLSGSSYNLNYYNKEIERVLENSGHTVNGPIDYFIDNNLNSTDVTNNPQKYFAGLNAKDSKYLRNLILSRAAEKQKVLNGSSTYSEAVSDINYYSKKEFESWDEVWDLESQWGDILGINDGSTKSTASGGSSGGRSGSSGKSALELAKEEYEAKRKADDDYIRQRELYDDWGEDSKLNVYARAMKYTDEAYKSGILSWEEYYEEISELSEDYYSELKDMVEDESKRVKEQLENEYKEKKELMEDEYKNKKQLMEDELSFRKEMYDKEIGYLDELKEKRNDEKEDEDYAKRMARLQAKLEYETDEDNRRALEKEIAELQEEIEDTEFDREIERKKNVLENRKASEEEKTETSINRLTANYEKGADELAAYYENAMSEVNIADTVYKNLDFDKFKKMGAAAGEEFALGISGGLEPFINAINKLVSLSADIKSPVNNTVTTDNSVSITQYNSGVGSVPSIAQLGKEVANAIFLNGRLG